MPTSTPRGATARPLKLIEIHREDIESLPTLMTLLRAAPHRFLVFCDDLSFDGDDTSYKSLKAALEGGVEGRPPNVLFYATSNRRHLMPRDMMENERSTAINPGEAVEEKVSLSDRFGLWLGFHKCSQDEYLEMVFAYCAHFGLEREDIEPRRWNGRRRAAPAPAAPPGNSCRIWRGGPGSGQKAEIPPQRRHAPARGVQIEREAVEDQLADQRVGRRLADRPVVRLQDDQPQPRQIGVHQAASISPPSISQISTFARARSALVLEAQNRRRNRVRRAGLDQSRGPEMRGDVKRRPRRPRRIARAAINAPQWAAIASPLRAKFARASAVIAGLAS